MKKLKTILRSKYFLKIIAITIILLDIFLINLIPRTSKYTGQETSITGKITRIVLEEKKLTITLQAKESIIVHYYYQEEDTVPLDYQLGDDILVTGSLTLPSQNTVPNLFNYQKYLYNKNIYYLMNATKLEKIKNNESLIFFLKNQILNRISNFDQKVASYLEMFLLGEKRLLEEEILTSYQQNGISHLFAISGMHVGLFVSLLTYLLKKISYNNLYKYSIITIFLLFYFSLVNYSASILRVIVTFILNSLNKIFNIQIKSLDLVLTTCTICILIDPYIIYDLGFQYSYLISTSIIIFSSKISNQKNYLFKSLMISWISFLLSLPISIYNFYQTNIISILLNLFLIPFVSFILFPLSLLTFFFPFLSPLYLIAINIIELTSTLAEKIEFTKILIAKPHLVLVGLYYIAIFLGIYRKKYLSFLLLLIIINQNLVYFDKNLNILVIDVGQGDSMLIRLPHNQGNILIDTGGTYQSTNYSIVESKTIEYLKSLGLTKLDYLILTHGDYDHMGEAVNLVNNFKVNKVIFNNGEYNDLELQLIKVLEEKKIPYCQNIKELNISSNKLYFLNNKLYDNENDNSIVIYTELSGTKLLLMGDAGVEVEEDLLKKYNLNDIDILKIGHHGSETSTSKEFISQINPQMAIISVGKNNRYGHPALSVLETLQSSGSTIYRTDLYGSIKITINSKKGQLTTYPAYDILGRKFAELAFDIDSRTN